MSFGTTQSKNISGKTNINQRTAVEPWTRNPDWLPMPDVTGQQKFAGLYKVDPYGTCYASVQVNGNYTVDWGDGTIENFNSGVLANHTYNYDTYDVNNDTVVIDSGEYYKQAIIIITPQSGQSLNNINTHVRHPSTTTTHVYNTGWLDIDINGSLLDTLTMSASTVIVRHANLERFVLRNNAIIQAAYICANCIKLQSVDITLPVATGIGSILNGCKYLKRIDRLVTNGNTLTNCISVFANCNVLEEIPFFDMGKATSASTMFNYCYNLKTIPLLDFSSVTTADGLFWGCFELKTLPLINLKKNTTFANMFQDCYNLETIPLIDTSSATSLANMFQGCANLKTIPLLNTSNAITFSNMFSTCANLKTIPLLNTSNGIAFQSMFNNCYTLQSIPLIDISKATTIASMFNNCYSLESLPELNMTSACSSISSAFQNCRSLKTIPPLYTAGVSDFSFAFSAAGITNLPFIWYEGLGYIPLDFTNGTNYSNMFQGCSNLITAYFRGSAKVTNISSIFGACSNLKEFGSGAAPVNLTLCTNVSNPFTSCFSLTKSTFINAKLTHSYLNCKLSATELNEIYTNLATVTGQTITVTGNPGTTGDTPSIATAKGWTVTG